MANASSQEDSPQDPRPVILTPGSSIDSGWRAFCQKHESWLTRFAYTNPLYRLPSKVISTLTRSKRLDAKAAQAERDLAKLCGSSHVVGFLNGRPINYRLLFGPMPRGLGSATRTMDQLPAQHPLRKQLAE